LSFGLPFASKILLTALELSPSAPNPYTVSVGKATSPPSRITAAASLIITGSGMLSDIRHNFVVNMFNYIQPSYANIIVSIVVQEFKHFFKDDSLGVFSFLIFKNSGIVIVICLLILNSSIYFIRLMD
jgi:hypothetical protein